MNDTLPQSAAEWTEHLKSLPRPDLEGHRPSPEEFQLWVGAAHGLLKALAHAQ